MTWHLSTESIYQALYDPATPLQRSAEQCLRTRRARRRPRRHPMARAARPAKMRPLEERPAGAADRTEAGHWEGDLITGAANRSAIGTLAERVSRYVMLVHVDGRHTTEVTCRGVTSAMQTLPPALRKSLTWDQGTEMAGHEQITDAIGVPVFFCEPRSPWQRPTNENCNGLLRDYFPKGTNLAQHSPADLRRVQDEINDRPRKCLEWRTPAEVLEQLQCRSLESASASRGQMKLTNSARSGPSFGVAKKSRSELDSPMVSIFRRSRARVQHRSAAWKRL